MARSRSFALTAFQSSTLQAQKEDDRDDAEEEVLRRLVGGGASYLAGSCLARCPARTQGKTAPATETRTEKPVICVGFVLMVPPGTPAKAAGAKPVDWGRDRSAIPTTALGLVCEFQASGDDIPAHDAARLRRIWTPGYPMFSIVAGPRQLPK